jgi:hypothetical protein
MLLLLLVILPITASLTVILILTRARWLRPLPIRPLLLLLGLLPTSQPPLLLLLLQVHDVAVAAATF